MRGVPHSGFANHCSFLAGKFEEVMGGSETPGGKGDKELEKQRRKLDKELKQRQKDAERKKIKDEKKRIKEAEKQEKQQRDLEAKERKKEAKSKMKANSVQVRTLTYGYGDTKCYLGARSDRSTH